MYRYSGATMYKYLVLQRALVVCALAATTDTDALCDLHAFLAFHG